MTTILHNGDYQPDGKGGFLRAQGREAVLADALFRLQCRRGAFAFLPDLGSRLYLLHREKPSARDMVAGQYAVEALQGLPVQVLGCHVGQKEKDVLWIQLELAVEDSTAQVEVYV